MATTPNKNKAGASGGGNSSPGKFIRPADLFKMRRNSTKTITLTPSNYSNSSNPGANISFHLHSSPLGGFSHNQQQKLPPVPCSPNFKRISAAQHIEPPSPLKCLSNFADPSPTKNLPTILKNPFDKPVKRRLNLSPKKAIKRSKMLALDEDANLEPPKTKPIESPVKGGKDCSSSDWTLKTKLKVRFSSFCKNWNESSSTTHRRFQDSSSSSSSSSIPIDSTISLEAIKNIATVYQHPYFSWLPLYPRTLTGFHTEKDLESRIDFKKSDKIISRMMGDWCDSLDDLTNLLIEGKCPYFYLCSDNYNVLFKQSPNKDRVQVYVSPFTFGMASELNKLRVEYRYPRVDLKDTSQSTPGSSRSAYLRLDNLKQENSSSPERMAPSIDSGHCSELSDDEDGPDATRDASQILQTIGLSDKDVPNIISKQKGFVPETDSNTQSSSKVPLAIIEGLDNLQKFIKFIKENKLYTITNLGKFAHVPPTLLSPSPFRLGTPQVPEIIMSQNVMKRATTRSPSKSGRSSSFSVGPANIEITGAVLPNLHKELHNLLVISENQDHTCQSTTLESSAPFSTIKF